MSFSRALLIAEAPTRLDVERDSIDYLFQVVYKELPLVGLLNADMEDFTFLR